MSEITQAQVRHFKNLYKANKGTPMAVSSESPAHKRLRYEELSRVFLGDDSFSIHDVGMGLGDYHVYLKEAFPALHFDYSGSEIVKEFWEHASCRFPQQQFHLRDISERAFEDRYDYLVMSGVFHQRRDTSIPQWEAYARRLIANCFAMCRKAVGFNFISPFVDFYQTEVYYCNLSKILNFIVDDLSRFFLIQHNYALFEFTTFVYRPEYIKSKFRQPEFQKYFEGGK